jgi:DNA-binding transcriptional ArsR family regulator
VFDKAYRALADPTRRAILRYLSEGDLTAGELGEKFGMTAPAMSHHFNVLKEGGLVEARRNGQQIVYSLNTTAMQDLARSLMDTFSRGEVTHPLTPEGPDEVGP